MSRRRPGSHRRDPSVYAVCAVLVLLTIAVFWQAVNFPFINLDDPRYVSENPVISQGLSAGSIAWALRPSYEVGNWHPITWLSLLLDHSLSGLDAGAFHLTNIILHAIAAILLFVVLNRTTRAIWRSAFVAVLFAIHPLHVESVAWVSERKDVLSGVFWMLTILAYAHWTAKPTIARYLLVVVSFALGLMAKAMLVSLPLVLMLLDYWPLARSRGGLSPYRPVTEKLPLFVLSAASCVVTMVVQARGGAMESPESYGLGVRLANAAVSSGAYLWKMIWPANLAVVYPHPGTSLPVWQVAATAAVLVIVTLLVWALRVRRPYLLVGWLWYLITLVPVIGLVQVGVQGMADRYTYIPLIGVFIMIAWVVPDLVRHRLAVAAAAAAAVAALSFTAWKQVSYWRSDLSLFGRALEVTEDNYVAEHCLGVALAEIGEPGEAERHYRAALRLDPRYVNAHVNLAAILMSEGRSDEALPHLLAAVKCQPDHPFAHTNLGSILAEQNRLPEAERRFKRAIEVNPEDDVAHDYLGIVLARQGKIEEALEHFSEAVRLQPGNESYWNNYNRARAASQ